MDLMLYGALLLAQAGTSTKQFAMKKCGSIAPGAFNSVCINLARALICLAVSAIICIFTGGGATTLFGHVIIIISGIGTAFNLFTWILSSQLVPLTLIESVSMIGSMVIPLILAPYLYNGDTVSPIQWLGCALVIVSAFLFMKKGKKIEKNGSAFQKIAIVATCAISITLASILKKYYTYSIVAKGLGNIEYFTFVSFLTVLAVFSVLFAIYYKLERKRALAVCTSNERPMVKLPYKRVWEYILIAGVALYVNELFTSYASQLPSAIYYPLSKGLTVGCTFLLDTIVFKDKVTLKKTIGLITVITAIILINL
jgi:multidrug transporter EmrE-like cation transporter